MNADPSPGALSLTLTVLLVDDDEQYCRAFTRYFRNKPQLEVVRSVPNALAAAALLAHGLRPHMVVVDQLMPLHPGLDLVAWAKRYVPQVRVVLMSGAIDAALQRDALLLGARGCVHKRDGMGVYLGALKCFTEGRLLLSPSCVGGGWEALLPEVHRPGLWCRKKLFHRTSRLPSPRQLELLANLSAGRTYGEIARRLRCARSSVAEHIRRIGWRYDLSGRAALERFARETVGLSCTKGPDRDECVLNARW